MAVISIRNLTKTYTGNGEKLTVLNGLNLEITEKGIYLIKGRSGSGKSTLLNIIGGLDKPSSGEILLEGINPAVLDDQHLSEFRNMHIGFVFQFHFLLKDFTALENVSIPGYISGNSKKSVHERAVKLLEHVGLKDRMTHLPGELSGGERQRVAIARALINNPPCILADEPTGNLDERTTGEVLSLLFSITEEFNKTLLMVTHESQLRGQGVLLELEKGILKR